MSRGERRVLLSGCGLSYLGHTSSRVLETSHRNNPFSTCCATGAEKKHPPACPLQLVYGGGCWMVEVVVAGVIAAVRCGKASRRGESFVSADCDQGPCSSLVAGLYFSQHSPVVVVGRTAKGCRSRGGGEERERHKVIHAATKFRAAGGDHRPRPSQLPLSTGSDPDGRDGEWIVRTTRAISRSHPRHIRLLPCLDVCVRIVSIWPAATQRPTPPAPAASSTLLSLRPLHTAQRAALTLDHHRRLS